MRTTEPGKYRPVPCDIYDHFEIAIIHRKHMRLAWRNRRCTKLETVKPLDLRTFRGGEYLIAEAMNGCKMALRLDRIQAAEEI